MAEEYAKIHHAPAEVITKGGASLRNFASDLCEFSWALWLSSDDTLQSGGLDEIKRAIQRTRSSSLLVNITDSSLPGFSFKFPRVFRTNLRWEGRAHECLKIEHKEEVNATILHTPGPWHDRPSDTCGVLKFLWQDIQEDPNNPRWHYYYARELYARKDFVSAAAWFQKRVSQVGQVAEMADAYFHLAQCYGYEKKYALARSACAAALTINADLKDAVLLMSMLSEGTSKKKVWQDWSETCQETNSLCSSRAIMNKIEAVR